LRTAVVAALLSLGIGGIQGRAVAADFVIEPGGKNEVVFVSKALMETFEGKTRKMSGRLKLDPDSLGDSVAIRVEVDLASLDTGIAMRNQHMRENHLETDRYPLAVFEGAAVLTPAAALDTGRETPVEIEGTFTLHGVARRLKTDAFVRLERVDGRRSIAFRTSFPVTLSDFGISRPEFLFLKLGETQQVKVRGVAIETQAPSTGGPK
jgi:polyisoprenoid-binding protein YceI